MQPVGKYVLVLANAAAVTRPGTTTLQLRQPDRLIPELSVADNVSYYGFLARCMRESGGPC